MRTLTACTALAAALSLAACQPAADEAGADSADAAGADAATADDAATPASADGDVIEARAREGLWQITMSADGVSGLTTRVCMDDNMSAIDTGQAPGGDASTEDCTQNITRRANGFDFTSRCDLGEGGVTETEGSMTGDMETAYRMEATVTTTGSPIAAVNRTSQVVTEGAYQGACPEGWRPGDMEMPGGLGRINMNDMRDQAAAQAGG